MYLACLYVDLCLFACLYVPCLRVCMSVCLPVSVIAKYNNNVCLDIWAKRLDNRAAIAYVTSGHVEEQLITLVPSYMVR